MDQWVQRRNGVNPRDSALPALWTNALSIGLEPWLFHSTLQLSSPEMIIFLMSKVHKMAVTLICLLHFLWQTRQKNPQKPWGGQGVKEGGGGRDREHKKGIKQFLCKHSLCHSNLKTDFPTNVLVVMFFASQRTKQLRCKDYPGTKSGQDATTSSPQWCCGINFCCPNSSENHPFPALIPCQNRLMHRQWVPAALLPAQPSASNV